jgi:hypothetical protein
LNILGQFFHGLIQIRDTVLASYATFTVKKTLRIKSLGQCFSTDVP